MEIIALQDYTDKYVSLYEGEVRNIGNNLANRLIAKEIVAEHDSVNTGSSSSGGNSSSSGGGVVYIETTGTDSGGGGEDEPTRELTEINDNDEDNILTLQASYNDIVDLIESGKAVFVKIEEHYDYGAGTVADGYGVYPCQGYCIYKYPSEEDEAVLITQYEAYFGTKTFYSSDPDENMTDQTSGGGGNEGF